MVEIKGLRGPAGEFGAVGRVEVPANSARDVYDFVCDVEQQPGWNSGVKQSKVLDAKGNHKTLHQVLQWNFLTLKGDMHFILDQTEDPSALEIRTELQRGTMMRRFRSRVTVSATTTPGLCEVEMEMFMQPAIFVPPVIRSVVGMQVRNQLGSVLDALQRCLQQRHQLSAGAAAAAAAAAWLSHPLHDLVSDDLDDLSSDDLAVDIEDSDRWDSPRAATSALRRHLKPLQAAAGACERRRAEPAGAAARDGATGKGQLAAGWVSERWLTRGLLGRSSWLPLLCAVVALCWSLSLYHARSLLQF